MPEDTADTDSSTVSPSDAVTDTEATPTEPGAPGEGGDSGRSISDLLLSTEPAEHPDEYQIDPKVAHIIIGGKKMLRGAGADVRAGTTALENFVRAGVGFVTSGGGESGDVETGEDTV